MFKKQLSNLSIGKNFVTHHSLRWVLLMCAGSSRCPVVGSLRIFHPDRDWEIVSLMGIDRNVLQSLVNWLIIYSILLIPKPF